jgi:hypothetical protein
MRGKFKGTILALSAVMLLMASTSMWAGTNLGLQLTAASPDPGQATICDNSINYPGCTGNASDLNPALGQITFIGGVGSWTSNVTSGFGPPYEQLTPLLDISSFNATVGAGGGPLTVLLSVSGLTSPNGLQTFLNSFGGTNSAAGTIVTSQAFYSATNTPFCAQGCAGAVAITPLLTLSGAAFSGMTNGSALLGSGPYAITLEVTINTNGAADTTSFDDSLSLPEPATLSLLGSGLLGFGMAFKRLLLRA